MKGLGWSTLSILGATVSSMEGQNGRQRSRNLICSLIRSATPLTLGHIVDLLPLGLVRVAGAGGNDILVAVAGTEVDVFHLLHRHAILHRDVGGGTDSGTGIAGSGLDEQLLDLGAGNDLLVEFDVQRAAAGK